LPVGGVNVVLEEVPPLMDVSVTLVPLCSPLTREVIFCWEPASVVYRVASLFASVLLVLLVEVLVLVLLVCEMAANGSARIAPLSSSTDVLSLVIKSSYFDIEAQF
jgi:hypothetical protein